MFTFPQKIYAFFLLSFIATAPILFLPEIPVNAMRNIKITLITSAFVLFIIDVILYKGRIIFPVTIIWIFFFCTLLMTVFISNSIDNLNGALNYSLNFLFSFGTTILAFNSYELFNNRKKGLIGVYLFILLICIFPISNFFYDVPDWNHYLPPGIDYGYRELWYTGFALHRTNWSSSLALFVPLSLCFTFKKDNLLILLSLILLIVTAQFISTGRGGLIASLLALLIITYKKFKWKGLLYLLVTIIIGVGIFFDDILIALRIMSISDEALDLSDVTSLRSDLFKLFPELFLKNPFFGGGYESSLRGLQQHYILYEMHNSVLRVIIDHGIIFGFLVIIICIISIKYSIMVLMNKNSPTLSIASAIIILQGLGIAMFEPAMIFGGFQSSSLWWFSVGILAYDAYKNNKLSVHVVDLYKKA